MELTIGKKTVELKFNFKAFLKANNEYSTFDENGNNMGDGAANLFVRLASDDLTVIPDVIKVAGNIGKVSEDDLDNAIDELTEGGSKIDVVMDEMKGELKDSGFFAKSIKGQMKTMEKALPILEKKAKTEEETQQVEAVKRIQKLLSENF